MENLTPPQQTIEDNGISRTYEWTGSGWKVIDVEITDFSEATDFLKDRISDWIVEEFPFENDEPSLSDAR